MEEANEKRFLIRSGAKERLTLSSPSHEKPLDTSSLPRHCTVSDVPTLPEREARKIGVGSPGPAAHPQAVGKGMEAVK